MTQVLGAVHEHGLDAVLQAVQVTLDSGRSSGDHVLNVLSRLKAPAASHVAATTPLNLTEEPAADVGRYERRVGFTSWPLRPVPQGFGRCGNARPPPNLPPHNGGTNRTPPGKYRAPLSAPLAPQSYCLIAQRPPDAPTFQAFRASRFSMQCISSPLAD